MTYTNQPTDEAYDEGKEAGFNLGTLKERNRILKDLKEFRNIHSIGVTALLDGKDDEQLQQYTDKVIESVYDFLINHIDKQEINEQ